MIDQKWSYLERYTFHGQNADVSKGESGSGHGVLLETEHGPGRNTPQTECVPSQKVRGSEIWSG